MSRERSSRAPRGARLLIVDDEEHQREMLAGILSRAGYVVETAGTAAEALRALAASRFDLLLTDQKMPGMDGLSLLERVQSLEPGLPVILMTAYGSVSEAVAAMQKGAADYLTKPFEREELILVLEKALRQHRLEEEVAALRGVLKDRYRLDNIIGTSPAMQEVFSMIERIAHTTVPVLIRGESGTGKELVACAIHARSRRAAGPFVALNCAAVPETLLESEFFGHERGAFTGATRSHPGRFEQATGGTLFLDEIGAMRIDLQAKLLRAIQEKEIQRLGSTGTTPVDVRILAATGENLEEAIRRKTFREDLFYRLSVVPLHLPALRERGEDIPLLVHHFVGAAAGRFGRDSIVVTPEVMDRLQIHPWLGNVRELENCIERMVLLSKGTRLTLADLPPDLRKEPGASAGAGGVFDLPPTGVRLPELERHLILQALRRCRGSLGPAAKLLGISYKTLQYRIQKFAIDRTEFGAEESPRSEGGDARHEDRAG
ncbi:MAG TPA: sigma-54 dependent transcriptional regulator [Candidatus Polarisedimenticolia bacterium]|jgi:two-component system NtrC family response regulator|nr:sigma-54 dependent transcriptional regulator [Candidatus Polarisedimenticolia bacterium]